MVENFKQQPTLDKLAQYIGISPFHFQKTFTEWVGVSPKKFLEHLTIEALKQELQDTFNLIGAAENRYLSIFLLLVSFYVGKRHAFLGIPLYSYHSFFISIFHILYFRGMSVHN